jgi:hypothetical protein
MTKEDFALRLGAFLKIAFPEADAKAHSEMDAISLEIAGWVEELIDARIQSMNLVDITITDKHRKALNEPIETVGGWGGASLSPPGSGRRQSPK